MVHTKEAVLMLDTPSESGESCVLGSTILRSQIVRIQFCSKMPLEVCQGEMWDVSAAHDRSILAWAKKVFISSKLLYELYIASDTKIKLQNARGLFWGYENLCEINLDKWIDSSSVSDMSNMFCRCESLTSIDISYFDTSHTESFARMFRDCVKVEILDVSHFQTQRVLHMENMFYGCKCLKYLDLCGFDCSKAADLSYMFYGCQSLKNVLTAKRSSDRKHRAIMIELLAGCKKLAEEKKGMGI